MTSSPEEDSFPAPIARFHGDPNRNPEIVQDARSDVLRSITKPYVALALWHRRLPGTVKNWLELLSPDQLPCGRVVARQEEVTGALEEILHNSGTPRGKETSLFMWDVVRISTLFAAIAQIDLVDIGVEPVQDNSCWKFHRDHVRLRALTTYCGPGTQFVDPQDADRALRDQKSFCGTVHQIPRHSVAIFKGAKDALGRGVVHRSPPIAGTDQTRLVVTLNLPSETSPAIPYLGSNRNEGASP